MPRKYLVFQDESGEIKNPYFFSGVTVIPKTQLIVFEQIVNEIREENKFFDEFHFEKMSKKRYFAYKALLLKCLKDLHFYHKTIVVDRNKLDMSYFGNQKHIAYNFFTKLVIYQLVKNLRGKVYIYPDEKNRIKKDNFLDYLRTQLNIDFMVI